MNNVNTTTPDVQSSELPNNMTQQQPPRPQVQPTVAQISAVAHSSRQVMRAPHPQLRVPNQVDLYANNRFLRKSESADILGDLICSRARAMRSFSGEWIFTVITAAFCLIQPDLLWLPLLLCAHILLRCWLAVRYRIYQNRIDFIDGPFTKRVTSIWLYQIINVDLYRSPIDILTGSITIKIVADSKPIVTDGPFFMHPQGYMREEFWIRAIGGAGYMNRLFDELNTAWPLKRKAIKNFLT